MDHMGQESDAERVRQSTEAYPQAHQVPRFFQLHVYGVQH